MPYTYRGASLRIISSSRRISLRDKSEAPHALVRGFLIQPQTFSSPIKGEDLPALSLAGKGGGDTHFHPSGRGILANKIIFGSSEGEARPWE